MTDNHEYNTPQRGATDWHVPLNENFEKLETDVEVRGPEADRDDYEPVAGAKFLATDTGAVYLGDGSQWLPVASTGTEPSFDAVDVDELAATDATLDSLVTDRIGTQGANPLRIRSDGDRVLSVSPHVTKTNEDSDVEYTAPNVVAGHHGNAVGDDVVGAVISGGGSRVVNSGHETKGYNEATADFATIGGGVWNTATGMFSTIAGGNTNNATGEEASIGGGLVNTASGDKTAVCGGARNTAEGWCATVGGGSENDTTANISTVGGGSGNVASEYGATVSGGTWNEASGEFATIAAGSGGVAAGECSTVGGGEDGAAMGDFSTVGGGESVSARGKHATSSGGSRNKSSGEAATVPGGKHNKAAGAVSFAAGAYAEANHDRSFVWSPTGNSFETTGEGQFLVDAPGSVGLGTDAPKAPLDVASESNWNLDNNEGDVRIGDDDYRLCIGVSLGGVGKGTSRLRAKGSDGNPRLKLGAGDTDTTTITDSAVRPTDDGDASLGTSSRRWSRVYAQSGTVSTSDARLKTDVAEFEGGLDAVRDLRPVSYRWSDDPAAPDDGDPRLGFLAQEVADVVPDAVEEPADEDGFYGLDYDQLVPVLVGALQEQQERIEAQEDRLEALEDELRALHEAVTDDEQTAERDATTDRSSDIIDQ